MLRISFAIEGGLASFPGLRRPTLLDLDAMPDSERARLCTLIEQARFFERPEAPARPPMPDARTYTLAIEDDGRRRELRFSDPVQDPALGALLHAVRASCDARRASPDAPEHR